MKMMKKHSTMRPSLLYCAPLALIIILTLATNTSANDHKDDEDDHSFTYDPSFYWGQQKQEWRLCKIGRRQSPININPLDTIESARILSTTPARSNAFLFMNREERPELRWEDNDGSVSIGSEKYALKHAHWHEPSEHTFNNTRYPLEVHLVHENDRKQMLVVAHVYRETRMKDAFIARLEPGINELIENPSATINVGPVPQPMIPRGAPFYRYSGSLTTPPCSEGVTWILDRTVRSVTLDQVNLLRRASNYISNSRPVQPINMRPVYLHQSRPIPIPRLTGDLAPIPQ